MDLIFSKSASDQDLEGSVNIICHLVPRIPAPGAAAAATLLASAFAATPTVRSDRRLQALVNLYNVVWDPQSKLAVLLKALAFSRIAGHADVMLGVVRTHADSWASTLRLSPQDERNLYVACADALKGCTRKPKTAAKERYRLLCKYVSSFENASPAEAAASGTEVAAQVVSEFLRSNDLFHFDQATNPAVTALASSPQHAPLHKLLTIYLTGTVTEYKSFASSNKGVFETLEITEESASTKMRLLALMGLAHGTAEITYDEIATGLDIPSSEVESVVVQAIGKRLIEARINQLASSVSISKCAPRTFGPDQWKELQQQLRSWKDSTRDVLQLGKDEKAVLSKGIAELSLHSTATVSASDG